MAPPVGREVSILYILLAILVLLFMVTVHELGHYVSGKLLGFRINEFAIGMGPAIFSRTRKNGEKFSIRVLPLGGFCAFDGEDEEASDPACFNNQKPWKRIIVLVSGAFMNFLVAMLIIINIFLFAGMYFPKINMLLPDFSTTDQVTSPLQAGDIIFEINGRDMYLSNDMSVALASVKEDEKFDITVVRNGEIITIKDVVKRAYSAYQVDAETGEFVRDEDGNYVLAHDDSGNLIESYGLGIYQGYESFKFGFFETLGRSFVYAFRMAGVILSTLGQLITGGLGLKDIGGPITTITMTAEIARSGLRNFLDIVALIGVNLAVFNLLPIPALDGSRVVFTVIEWIRGKPINRKVEAIINAVGLVLLLGFVIVADIYQLII